jgi:glycosyltransferase involved in cell wall biosynthesis
MKIAQIAPLTESCPPHLYGGTERIVSYLTEELVRQGHEVTLFASGDSRTAARLEPGCKVALRLDPSVRDPIPSHIVMLEKVRTLASQFDVLHFHVDVLHYPFLHSFVDKTVTTLHGRLDLAELRPLASPRTILRFIGHCPACAARSAALSRFTSRSSPALPRRPPPRFLDCRRPGRRRRRQPSDAQFIVRTSIAADRSSTSTTNPRWARRT